MADALLSPTVGVTFWTASGAALTWCAARVRKTLDDHHVPLMGVLGAFVFAAQMINFTIPGTGSSGHIGGGFLLAILLGPCPAFLTIASVLTIQAFFFADGGLLALGCNLFNLGVFPCFLGPPLFRGIAGPSPSSGRRLASAVAAGVVCLELGALGVVLETLLSGRSALTSGTFLALMGGIHLPIGIVEGVVTATVLGYVLKLRPELAAQAFGSAPFAGRPSRSIAPLVASLGAAAALIGGGVVWLASERPDGLEWSIARATVNKGRETAPSGLSGALTGVQNKTALLPDDTLPVRGNPGPAAAPAPAWPAVDAGRSLSGLLGAVLTLTLAAGIGLVFARRRRAEGR